MWVWSCKKCPHFGKGKRNNIIYDVCKVTRKVIHKEELINDRAYWCPYDDEEDVLNISIKNHL